VRPTKTPQSALRFPLNHVLGTEASVRVMRVIMLSDIPIGVSGLARLAELQASGVARVCERLEDLGVIEAVGRGSHGRQFRRAETFALNHQLNGLFLEERSRADLIKQDIQTAVRSASPQPRAGWIEGPVALGRDRPEDAIVVGVLVSADKVDSSHEDIWRSLLPIQRQHRITLELRVLTTADIETATPERQAELEQVLLLLGPPPLDLLRSGAGSRKQPQVPLKRTHARLDSRSLEFSRAIAERIRRDPSIVEDARRWIERRLPSASPGERLELEEWRDLLTTMSTSRLRRFLVQNDARATRLRQSLPFANVLSNDERRALSRTTGA